MNLTKLIRRLESELKRTETLTRRYDSEANTLRKKLTGIASIVGERIVSTISEATKSSPGRKKGGMSAAGRARIRAAQKARWAAFHAKKGKGSSAKAKSPAKSPAKASAPRKRRGKLSAACCANIIAAQKARWAKHKKSSKK